MSTEDRKQRAAEAAVELVQPGWVVGVGTGSTTNRFIDALARSGRRIDGAVASSRATAERLGARGLRVIELPEVDKLPLYVDGADEVNPARELLKGGGGALTREKIVAAASERFVCIVDDEKLVERLGRRFPIPLEVLPMATRLVGQAIERMGGRARLRDGFVTDNGNAIVDVWELETDDGRALEGALDLLVGVVENGLFCRRPADEVLVGMTGGVDRL